MASHSWLNRALAGSSQRPGYSPYGSYDSNNLDSQNMRGASELAASRVRNSGYFPYAASQAAAADGVGGALPYSNPVPRAPTVPRPLTPTEAYQKAADEAKAATLTRREQVLNGYDTSLNEADNLIGGALGMTDAERNARRGNLVNMAALRERGLGSGTEMSYAANTFNRNLKDINLDQAMRVANFRADLQGQKLRTLENINDTPPDTRPYDAAMRELGAGSTEGMQYPSGPPAIAGNPYGMPMGGAPQQAAPQSAPTGYDGKGAPSRNQPAGQTYQQVIGDRLRKRYAKPTPVAPKPMPPLPSVKVPSVAVNQPYAPPKLSVPAIKPPSYMDLSGNPAAVTAGWDYGRSVPTWDQLSPTGQQAVADYQNNRANEAQKRRVRGYGLKG